MKRTLKLISTLALSGLASLTGYSQDCPFEEVGGVVAFEAEDFFSQRKDNVRKWYVQGTGASTPTPDPDNHGGASGGKYLEILPDTRVVGHSGPGPEDPLIHGENFSNIAGQMTIVDYKVYFNSTGKYFVWVRANSSGPEDNGVHVGIDGTWPSSGERLQWCGSKNQWLWDSKQRTDAVHCGVERGIFLNVNSVGEHTISFSMREDGFEMDKIVLSKAYNKPSGTGPAVRRRASCDDTPPPTAGVSVSGELKRWHKVTLTADGPNTSETASPNPFMDYRFDATFTHEDGKSYTVPGYYSACGDPAEGCNSGNKWKVHFAPDRPGKWNYSLSFKSGTRVAIGTGGSSAGFFDGKTGQFNIAESDKEGRDFRNKNKGKLRYVGEHYLRFAGTGGNDANGNYFIKAGADAPENTLAYEDFDNTPNRSGRRKNWNPHQQDYVASDASSYTWKSGKGTELLGVVNYLAKKKVNSMSFLTLSLHGDDENVFPHLMKVGISTYNGYDDRRQWEDGVHHDRFDVSKMAQWEKIFEYADKKGIFLHFKTLETENDNIMDNNDDNPDENFGNERKIYYRELIARFGHHLALNWNLTEESTLQDNTVKQTSAYVRNLDPYQNHIVLHTYPWEKNKRYNPLLGNASNLTGASLQTDERNYGELQSDVLEWINKSASNNKKWVVCVDEPGNAEIGIDDDSPADNKLVRHKVLWNTLLSGGAGVEYYYGYQTDQTDLNAQNHRTRDQKYTEASYALQFFENYLVDKVTTMRSMDNVTADNSDLVFCNPGVIYVVYRPNGGSTSITLPGAGWKVQWYNPRAGGNITSITDLTGNLTAPDGNDWVAVITKTGITNVVVDNGAIGPEGYVYAVDEGTDVVITGGPVDIAYGQNGSYEYLLNQTGTVPCTNAQFGNDPLPMVRKYCFIRKAKAPYSGIPVTIPGIIEAEEYDFGGQNVSYFDADAENRGAMESNFRIDEGVDIGAGGSGYGIGWTAKDEWTEYTVDVESAGEYVFKFDVASNAGGGVLGIDANGSPILAGVEVPTTGGWDTYVSFERTASLTEGEQVLRFKVEERGFNLDKIDIRKVVPTSVLGKQANNIIVYPNPSEKGIFTLNESFDFEVFNTGGELIKSGTGNTIDLSSQTKGVYILQIGDRREKLVH